MAATRVSALRRLLITPGVDGEPIAAREERKRWFDFGGSSRARATSGEGSRTRPSAPSEGGCPGATNARRSDRSRTDQSNHILDHFSGHVLARRLGTYRFCTLRTPSGTTVAQGRDSMRILRVGLVKKFAYSDGLVLRPAETGLGLTYVSGSGWFGNYSLEASQDYSPHYHLMLALIGYDIAAFEEAILALWKHALSRVLGRPYFLGPLDVHFGLRLGPGTVRYMCDPKRTKTGHNPHDFRAVVPEGASLGTDWWHAWGGRCLTMVEDPGQYVVGVSVAELRERAVMLDFVRTNGREVPDSAAHFRDPKTEEPNFVVGGRWYGAAARYMATGSQDDLDAYCQELLEARRQERDAEGDFNPRGEDSDEATEKGTEVDPCDEDGVDSLTAAPRPSIKDVRREKQNPRMRRRTARRLRSNWIRFVRSWYVSSGAAIRRFATGRGRRIASTDATPGGKAGRPSGRPCESSTAGHGLARCTDLPSPAALRGPRPASRTVPGGGGDGQRNG